jgi:hypothetical protein
MSSFACPIGTDRVSAIASPPIRRATSSAIKSKSDDLDQPDYCQQSEGESGNDIEIAG